jgi:hypothetical protein
MNGTMLEQESQIRDAVNAVGRCATGFALKSFDTNGEPIVIEGALLHESGLNRLFWQDEIWAGALIFGFPTNQKSKHPAHVKGKER